MNNRKSLRDKLVDTEGKSSLLSIRLTEDRFRLCNKCKSINFYANKECITCHSTDLDHSQGYDKEVYKDVLDEYDFLIKKGFSYDDVGNIKIKTVLI